MKNIQNQTHRIIKYNKKVDILFRTNSLLQKLPYSKTMFTFFANLPIYSELHVLDLKTKNSLIVNTESNIAK